MTKHIPNSITSLNLAAGFFAIIHASQGDLSTAAWLLIAAMVFDFSDGFAARLLKAYSAVGKELDSLADVVSFGVAPGIMLFFMLRNGISHDQAMGLKEILLLAAPALIPVCAAIRLAVFNLDTTQYSTFKGLPTPASALAVVSLVLAGKYSPGPVTEFISASPLAILILIAVLSALMVSRIPLLSLKFSNMKMAGNEGRYLLIVMTILPFIILGTGAIILIIPVYLSASLLSLLFRRTE